MAGEYADLLNPEKALIFRITHRDNVPWIIANGLHAKNGALSDPNFRPIGNRDLIAKRTDHPIAGGRRGSLSDYIPFYFTPFSMMMLNIHTGYNGVPKVSNEELVIIVSSLRKVAEMSIDFLFTDQHAYLGMAEHYNQLDHLDRIDWAILQNRDFKRDNDDLGKTDRYQAEALVWKHLPIEGMLGVCCYTEGVRGAIKAEAEGLGVTVSIFKKSEWYFR